MPTWPIGQHAHGHEPDHQRDQAVVGIPRYLVVHHALHRNSQARSPLSAEAGLLSCGLLPTCARNKQAGLPQLRAFTRSSASLSTQSKAKSRTRHCPSYPSVESPHVAKPHVSYQVSLVAYYPTGHFLASSIRFRSLPRTRWELISSLPGW